MPFNPDRHRYEVQSLINHCKMIEEEHRAPGPLEVGDFEAVTSRLSFEIQSCENKLEDADGRTEEKLLNRLADLKDRRERVQWAGTKLLNHFDPCTEITEAKRILKQERRRLSRYQSGLAHV